MSSLVHATMQIIATEQSHHTFQDTESIWKVIPIPASGLRVEEGQGRDRVSHAFGSCLHSQPQRDQRSLAVTLHSPHISPPHFFDDAFAFIILPRMLR